MIIQFLFNKIVSQNAKKYTYIYILSNLYLVYTNNVLRIVLFIYTFLSINISKYSNEQLRVLILDLSVPSCLIDV